MNILQRINSNLTTSINIQVRKIYSTVDGVQVDKSTVPQAIQKKMPIYLFNKFDFDGGYKISSKETPPLTGLSFIRFFVKSDSYDFTQFSGLNDISNSLQSGDMVFLYADNALNPNYFVWIILSIDDKALSSIIQSTANACFELVNLKIFADNILNNIEDLSIIEANKFGEYDFNQVSRLAYKTPQQINDSFIQIPLEKRIHERVGFTTYIPFQVDTISFDFSFIK